MTVQLARLIFPLAVLASSACKSPPAESSNRIELRPVDVVRLATTFEEQREDGGRIEVRGVLEIESPDGGHRVGPRSCAEYEDSQRRRDPRAVPPPPQEPLAIAGQMTGKMWMRAADGGFIPPPAPRELLPIEPGVIAVGVEQRDGSNAFISIATSHSDGCFSDVHWVGGEWRLGASCGCWIE